MIPGPGWINLGSGGAVLGGVGVGLIKRISISLGLTEGGGATTMCSKARTISRCSSATSRALPIRRLVPISA